MEILFLFVETLKKNIFKRSPTRENVSEIIRGTYFLYFFSFFNCMTLKEKKTAFLTKDRYFRSTFPLSSRRKKHAIMGVQATAPEH